MAISNPELWNLIRDYRLPFRAEPDENSEPKRICQSFEDNVRKEGDWTDVSAHRLVEEYRRFLYLKALANGPLTPPEVIDKVWHLHLAMGRDFQDRFCPEIGRVLTHDPGISRQQAFAFYEQACRSYVAEFDHSMPPDIWPLPQVIRQAKTWRRIAGLGLGLFLVGMVGPLLWIVLENTIGVIIGDPDAFRRSAADAFVLPFGIRPFSTLVLVVALSGLAMAVVGASMLPGTPTKISRCG